MKINDLMGDVISKYGKQSKILDKNQPKKAVEKEAAAPASAVKDDKVEISKDAKILLELDNSNGLTDKLYEIKRAVNNGTYKPNIEETAKAILREWSGE